MKVEIKNLLYHPIQLLLENGESTSISGRDKKIFDEETLSKVQLESLKNKQYIKVKNI
jgi:hypothetical protein